MTLTRTVEHNEYFRPVTAKKCECGSRGLRVWSWGEYVRGKWRTVKWFCGACFNDRVWPGLNAHTTSCGCKVNLIGYRGEPLPRWLTMKPIRDIYTPDRVKEELPDIHVKFGHRVTVPAKLTGRARRFARVVPHPGHGLHWGDGVPVEIEAAWETLAHCINENVPLCV